MIRRPRPRDERGVALILVALSLVALMAAASFAVDLGEWYVEASTLQRAADAAAAAAVVDMPSNFGGAVTLALETSAADGFVAVSNCTPDQAVTVCVTATPNVHQIQVAITDTGVRQAFSSIFLHHVTETRTSIAEYDLPVPLGSPENSLGTGNLACDGQPAGTVGTCIRPADVWLSVNGFCAAREEGDEFASYYDANYYFGRTTEPDCPLAKDKAPSTPSTEFANPLYRYPTYTYDIEVPGANGVGLTTGANFTVQIYDPGFYDGGTAGDRQIGTDPLGGDQQTLQWQLWKPGSGAPLNHANDIQIGPLTCTGYSKSTTTPCLGAFASGPSNNQTAIGGCADAEGSWCTLAVIPSGYPAGQYQLTISTQPDQVSSNTVNDFALRAWDSTKNPSGFVPCATIAETDPAGVAHAANTTDCPEMHGDDAMSIYVDGQGGPSYTNLQGKTVACNFQNLAQFPTQDCSVFFLAGIPGSAAAAYAGRQLQILLFDPGEGATGIHIIQPNGSLAQVSYSTQDTNDEGPGAIAPVEPASPNPGTGTCVCDTWAQPTTGNPGHIGPGNLPGRQGTGQYNDRILAITTTIPAGLPTASESWYQIEYDYSPSVYPSGVTDRTTWAATVSGNPVHLVQ